MKFRDTRSWALWALTVAVVPFGCYLVRCFCVRIMEDPAGKDSMFFAILGILLINQMFIGASIWRLLDAQSEYEIHKTGFRSRKYAHKIWHQVTWAELPYSGIYRRWGIQRYAYFSNYPFDGKRIQGPLNDAAAKCVLFIIPLSKRGMEGIERYVPRSHMAQLKGYR